MISRDVSTEQVITCYCVLWADVWLATMKNFCRHKYFDFSHCMWHNNNNNNNNNNKNQNVHISVLPFCFRISKSVRIPSVSVCQTCLLPRPVRRRRRAAAISATPPPPTVRARRAAAADIFVDRRGGVAVPNSSLWLCVRAKLHICLLIVCWTDIRMKTLILSSFCSCVPMFSKAILA